MTEKVEEKKEPVFDGMFSHFEKLIYNLVGDTPVAQNLQSEDVYIAEINTDQVTDLVQEVRKVTNMLGSFDTFVKENDLVYKFNFTVPRKKTDDKRFISVIEYNIMIVQNSENENEFLLNVVKLEKKKSVN